MYAAGVHLVVTCLSANGYPGMEGQERTPEMPPPGSSVRSSDVLICVCTRTIHLWGHDVKFYG